MRDLRIVDDDYLGEVDNYRKEQKENPGLVGVELVRREIAKKLHPSFPRQACAQCRSQHTRVASDYVGGGRWMVQVFCDDCGNRETELVHEDT